MVESNDAVTVVSSIRVTTHVDESPEHPPPIQPVKVEPGSAVAVSVTMPLSKGAEQFVVQVLMPAGFEETDPVPFTTTVSLGWLKLAVTIVLSVKVKLQGPVPEQPAPLQPVKFETLLGVAVITMAVPGR